MNNMTRIFDHRIKPLLNLGTMAAMGKFKPAFFFLAPSFSMLSFSVLCLLALGILPSNASASDCPEWLDHSMKRLHKNDALNLCEITKEKPILLINTASHCGFTPQFKKLEAIHQRHAEDGLVVIGIASNSFKQEAASEEKIAEICYVNFGVTFTMLSPVDVKGVNAHPLFLYLGEQSSMPRWNFNKYLISRDRKSITHFSSREIPDTASIQNLF